MKDKLLDWKWLDRFINLFSGVKKIFIQLFVFGFCGFIIGSVCLCKASVEANRYTPETIGSLETASQVTETAATSSLNLTPTPRPTPVVKKSRLAPALVATATPKPTPTTTPEPTTSELPLSSGITFEETLDSPEARYQQALANGEVKGPSKKHITKRSGVYKGPSGRETYYNLKMDLVVKYMRHLGYKEKDYPYWVRSDGAKMLGNYVMVAANLKIRPKGTILETSLGTAIVCDTGGFVKKYPKGIDIAVNWKI